MQQLCTEESNTFKKLNKTNTERLVRLHVKKFDAFPANPFDRKSILDAIKNDINAKITERNNTENAARTHVQELSNMVIILRQMKAEKEGKQLGPSLRDGDVIAIRCLHEDGMSFAKIGKMYGKQPNYIRNIVIGKLYKNVKMPHERVTEIREDTKIEVERYKNRKPKMKAKQIKSELPYIIADLFTDVKDLEQ